MENVAPIAIRMLMGSVCQHHRSPTHKAETVLDARSDAPACHHCCVGDEHGGGTTPIEIKCVSEIELSQCQARFKEGGITAIGALSGEEPNPLLVLRHNGARC